jgi:transcriptional regulator with XRE-family HTH domain
MEPDRLPLSECIAWQVRHLRTARGVSLDTLAARCGVSRSMISLIERAETSPTAVLLEKLAAGLDVTPAALFDQPVADTSPIARAKDQLTWRDPQSGYVRRNVSPPGVPSPIQLVEVAFPARARVAFENGARQSAIHQQVWVLEGTMEITLDTTSFRLDRGDCLAFELSQSVMYFNPTRKTTRYCVVIANPPLSRRK